MQDIINNNMPEELMSPKELRMEKAGLTRETAYKKIVEMQSAQVMTLDKFGGEHFAPDNTTQLRATEMVLKMRGDIKPDNMVDARVYNTQVSITPSELEAFTGIVTSMRDEIRNLKGSGRQTGEVIDVTIN